MSKEIVDMKNQKHPEYEIIVSEDGTIASLKTGKVFKQSDNEFGYMNVSVPSGEKGKTVKRKVHRLVAQTYIPNPENKREVNHIDGDKTNNHVSNLEWVTSKENKTHAWKSGLYTSIGEKHHDAIFTEEFIREICKMMQDGWRNKDIAEETGLHKDFISDLRTGRIWKSVSCEYNISFLRKERLSKEKVIMVAELLEKGLDQKTICEETGASKQQVSRILSRECHSKLTMNYKF